MLFFIIVVLPIKDVQDVISYHNGYRKFGNVLTVIGRLGIKLKAKDQKVDTDE
jgi:hypothetical protein